jgi:hypothetical protein
MRTSHLIGIGGGVIALAVIPGAAQSVRYPGQSYFGLWGWVSVGLAGLGAVLLLVATFKALTQHGHGDETGAEQVVHATAPAAATAFQGVQTVIIGDQSLVDRALQSYEENLKQISQQH